MDTHNLHKIDLNLLIALQVMLEERSVSRTAQRLFITQPAMSKTLSRLRNVFDDPLFTRTSHGMQPTPRALELGQDLDSILMNIQKLVADQHFVPAEWEGEITIALSEYMGVGILPPLMRMLQSEAPDMKIKTIARIEHELELLSTGVLDIAINMQHAHYPEEFMLHAIKGPPAVILAREGHPLTGKEVSWESITEYPLVQLYIADLQELKFFQDWEGIEEVREQRKGGFDTTHLLTALEVLRSTDYLMPGSSFILESPAIAYNIQAFPMPGLSNEELSYQMVRHRRTENSAVHNWLWQKIIEVLDRSFPRFNG